MGTNERGQPTWEPKPLSLGPERDEKGNWKGALDWYRERTRPEKEEIEEIDFRLREDNLGSATKILTGWERKEEVAKERDELMDRIHGKKPAPEKGDYMVKINDELRSEEQWGLREKKEEG